MDISDRQTQKESNMIIIWRSIKQLIFAFSLIALIIACASVTETPESAPATLSPSDSTLAALSNVTPTLYPTDVPNHYEQNDNFGDGFVPQVLIKDTKDLSREDILTKLVTLMLDYYKTKSKDPNIAIKDYKGIKVSKVIEDSNNSDGFFEIVAYVEFSIIHVGGLPGEDGIPINSGIHNEWVTLTTGSQGLNSLWWHIGSVFGYFRDGKYVRLRLLTGWGT